MTKPGVLRARITAGVFAVTEELLAATMPFGEFDFAPPEARRRPRDASSTQADGGFVLWRDYVRHCGMTHPPRTIYLRVAGPFARIAGRWDPLEEGTRFSPNSWWLDRGLKDFIVVTEPQVPTASRS
jgi:hypothetical protein